LAENSEVRTRIAVVSLLVAAVVAGVVAFVQIGTTFLGWEPPKGAPPSFFLSPGPLLPASLILFALTRWRTLGSSKLFAAATLYQYLGALVLALAAHWLPSEDQVPRGFFSWLAVWILLFPLVIPRTPARNLVDSVACACFAPLVIVASGLWGSGALPGLDLVFGLTHAYFACALLGAGPAFLVQRLSQRAMREREERERLGSYRLVRPISEGGMGEVWIAEHQLLVRPAAVKLIRQESLSVEDADDREMVLRRFEREAQETASLSSPHTVTIYDFGRTNDGAFYCAMEYLPGLDLEDLVIAQGPLPSARVAHLLRQACDSLAEAHESGLVHRDVKPANLFVSRQGLEYDFLKVLDFGLVTSPEEEGRSDRLSGTGHVVGTPLCMSPEQIFNEKLDGRTDLYGLGCAAYWLLTGSYPFEGETAIAVLGAHARDAPEPPSQRVDHTLHPALEELVLRCMSKSREDRPASALELRELLDALPGLAPWTQTEAELAWSGHQPPELAPAEGKSRASTLLLPSRLSRSPGAHTETWSHVMRVADLEI
tara:strand:- start:1523 stop:3148 length:1626 start_codon:yes stop_codon:yes gene_type:complete